MRLETVEHNFMGRGSAFENVKLGQIFLLSDQKDSIPLRSVLQRCEKLLSNMSLRCRGGQGLKQEWLLLGQFCSVIGET